MGTAFAVEVRLALFGPAAGVSRARVLPRKASSRRKNSALSRPRALGHMPSCFTAKNKPPLNTAKITKLRITLGTKYG